MRRDGVEFVNNYGRENEMIEEAPEIDEIPDLAKEVAQEAFANSYAMPSGKKAVTGEKPVVAASSLNPAHYNVLDTAVNELKACRKLLTQMTK